jgi:transposase-like protein
MKKHKRPVAHKDDDRRARRTHAETEEELRAALRTLKETGEAVNISAVAAAVGVTPGLIHNKYQTVAQEIRDATGRTTSVRLTDVQQQLKEALERNAELRQENTDLLREVRELASVNESLRQQLAVATAVDSGKVVRLPKR